VLTTREIQDWLITHIAELLDVSPETIDIREPFANYGLSSLDVVTLSGDLEELLGRHFAPTLAYDYPNILTLSRYLAENTENKKSSSPVNSWKDTSAEPIAVIGIGCRFPGARDPGSFWQLLRDGVDTISEVPADRWPKEAFYHPDPTVPGKAISYWGGFLDRIDQFDPFFFGISPIEAKHMDPQQRLLLELSYEALDDAGQTKANLDGTKTGVFVGISVNEYSPLQFADPLRITAHSGTGSALSIAANRISYFYNFRGPSMAIDTACSSSLSAVHLACQSIRSGECGMALAGGVNMILSPAHSIAFTKAGVLAPDGRCKTFDARANGYVRGEGGGLVVLKPLSSALADGDPVHALILGSAMSQDGRTNGLIAPSREAQEALLREAYHSAGISPGSVQYVEAHGTGTLLGDSMEAKALGAVFGEDRTNGPCAIGSVKTNIGHLEAAAGIAGLIKVILSLKHRTIPPSLHYHSPNPHIPFEELQLRVNNELNSWLSGSGPALAGVSSFGFGGTNVHMIVREAINNKQNEEDDEQIDSTASACHLLPLSANSYESLQSLAGIFQELLATDSAIATNDICYAASIRRSQYHYRLAAIGHSREELYTSLQAFLHREQDPNLLLGSEVPERQPKLAFVFPGQGGQWYGMSRELLQREPVFYQAIERIDHTIQAHFGWSLLEELAGERSESRLDEIDVVQPALFAIQVALCELWQSWGITPDAVVGHSMGEVAAAHVAGILSLEDAIRVICHRSQLLKPFRGQGSMLVTELSPDQARDWLRGYDTNIAIAVINSPTTTVLSGDSKAVNEVMESLQRQNLFCKLVKVDVASHSPLMDHLRSELLEVLDGLHPQPAKIPIYSTVTGASGDNLTFDANYWMDNLRKPVLFSDAIEQLLDSRHTTFIEIGPHPILLSSIQQSLRPHHPEVRLLPSLRREEPERKVLLGTLGALYTEGFSIDWNKLYPAGGKYVPLPLMPWQHQRYWMDTKSASSQILWHWSQEEGRNSHPLLGDRLNLANSPLSFVWQTEIDKEVVRFLEDHRIEEEIVFPAAAYIEMALQAAEETSLNKSHELSNFVFEEKMIFHNGKPKSIQALLLPDKEGSFSFSIYSRMTPEENWILHASVNFVQLQTADEWTARMEIPPNLIRQQGTSEFTSEEFYQSLQSRGVQYGSSFQAIQHVWSNENESLARISLPESLKNDAGLYQIHPAFLDACLQVLSAARDASAEKNLYLPTGCKYIRFSSQPDRIVWSHVSLQPEAASGSDVVNADIRLLDENDQIVAELIGFRLQRTGRRIRRLLSQEDTWLYQLRWQAQEASETSPVPVREKRNWLILADDEGLGEALAEQLVADGDHCHLLPCQKTIKQLKKAGEDAFAFPELIDQVLKEIPSPPYGIVHLWSLAIPPTSSDILKTLEKTELLGCNSVLYLVQALSRRLAGMPRLWLVTRGAQSVNAGEPVAVEQSPLWGLGKVISFEVPELKCIRIDLNPQQTNAETVPLLRKQLSIDDREDQIAFRAGGRYVLRLSPFTLGTSSCPPGVSLRADATYLITGGLGGLGLATAKWMTQRGARHLVLMGRSEPSPSVMNTVDQMRREGNEVVIAQADVSDPPQMERLVVKIEQNLPILRGVVHAAGVLDDGSLLNLNKERMKKVMAPKVDGTWNLHHATLNLPLDFFVLFSSAVSVLGSPGQGNYAAASSYLDAMAYFRRHLGLPAISINWGPWAEVGLAAEATERLKAQNASTDHLVKVIKIDQGLEILEQLLTESTPQVMALPFDLRNLIELYPTAAGMPFLAEVGGSDTHVARLYARPKLRQKYVAPRNEIERKLAALWRQTLHIDRVGVRDSFFELGGDSVLGAQILTSAQKNFGIRINPQDAFKAFTIERLAEMLEAEILSQIEEMSEDEAQRRLSKRK
jgi:acyl transferase domain-containing protein/acyl carrier protein